MPAPTEKERFLADLKDDTFVCYVVVDADDSEAWKVAKRAVQFVPMVNIYRFDDHAVIAELLGDGEPVGIAFSRRGTPVDRLDETAAADLDRVLTAMEKALRAKK